MKSSHYGQYAQSIPKSGGKDNKNHPTQRTTVEGMSKFGHKR